MKKNICNQIKNVGKTLYIVFICLGALCFLGGIVFSVLNFIENNLIKGYIILGIGVAALALCYLIAVVFLTVFNGFAAIVENTGYNKDILDKQDKIIKELEFLKQSKQQQPQQQAIPFAKSSGNKEDLSNIKKSPAIKQSEAKNKLEDLGKLNKNKPGEDIKEKLAKAKSVVSKIMAIKSQIAASNITTSMLDGIKDKNNLEQFETPEIYLDIEPDLFRDCKNLREIVITDNIKLIGSYAFSGCNALATLTIGKGVGVIENDAFEGCTGLNKVIYKGSKKQWEEIIVQSGNEILKNVDIVFEGK